MRYKMSWYGWGFKREFNEMQNVLVWTGLHGAIQECANEMHVYTCPGANESSMPGDTTPPIQPDSAAPTQGNNNEEAKRSNDKCL